MSSFSSAPVAEMSRELTPRFVGFEAFTDKGEKLNFSDVLQVRTWKTVSNDIFTGGYTKNVDWFKLTLTAPPNESLLLGVLMAILDDVRLYAPDELIDPNAHIAPKETGVTGWKVWQQGDLFPFDQREREWHSFNFALRVPDAAKHTVYLRVVSTSSHLIFPQIWQLNQFTQYQKNELLLLGFIAGACLIYLLIASFSWLLTRKILQQCYFFLVISWILNLSTLNGFFQQWFLADSPEIASMSVGFVALLYQIMGIRWIREILLGEQRQSIAYRCHNVVIVVGLFAVGLTVMGNYGLIVGAFSLLVLMMLAGDLCLVCWMWQKKKLSTHLFLIYSLVFLDTLVPMLCFSGYITELSANLIYSAQTATFVNLTILFFITVSDAYKTLHLNQKVLDSAALQAKATESQRYWLAMLTHEIKTPLSVINASCQSMELLKVEPTIQTRIDKIKRNTTRIDDLVYRFLHNDEVLARLQSLHPTKLDLKTWLPDQLKLFDEIAQKRWRLNIQSDLIIEADANLLSIALNNLLTNALKYSKLDSEIEISTQLTKQKNENGILFAVKDYGLPLNEQKRDFLFNRYQLNEYIGNGVGLWACREIARVHHGDVWLDDKRVDGNTFNIWLPIKNKALT
jgi:signal transduction histidine kinase